LVKEKDKERHYLFHRIHAPKMSSSEPTNPNPITQQQEEEEEVGKLAVRLANAVVLPMVLKSALELNLIEIISDAGTGAFLSPSEISARLPTKNQDAPVLLDRMLRLLASYSVLKCTLRTREDGEVERLYGVGPICKFFLKNPDGASVAPLFLLHHDKVFMESW
jgi:caffeic acid 3-O-methyltransferase